MRGHLFRCVSLRDVTIASIFLPFHFLPFKVGRYRLHVRATVELEAGGNWGMDCRVDGVCVCPLDGTFAGLC